jgi:prepilin-type N-terminal cleavage/methylation domain-containing protein
MAHRKRGFTLVELLVVVAIIALLVGMLLPTLQRAKDATYLVMCQNHQRNLIQAVIMYSTESSDYLPFANWASLEGWRAPYKGPGWLYQTKDIGTLTGPEGQIWKYIRNEKVYRCPTDKLKSRFWSVHALTSYIMNGSLCGFGTIHNRIYPSFKLSDFRAEAICIWEAAESPGPDIVESWNDGSSGANEGMTHRHRKGATVCCMGGYTEWFSYEQYDAEALLKPGRLWCVPNSKDGTTCN